MEIMVAGDWHGNTVHAVKMIKEAEKLGVKKIIQVGDFGLWTHIPNGHTFLDTLNETCRKAGIKVYALGGNHENWDHWNWYLANNPRTKSGFTILRSHILIAPRTHRWTWEGRKMLIVSGAVSIDKVPRLANNNLMRSKYASEIGSATLNMSWWPQEQITDAEIAGVRGPADYLFTHDCSNATPWRNRLKPDFESQIHRQRIDTVLQETKPKMHFHGHMHTKYDWHNRVGGDKWTHTIGLDMDGTYYCYGILDLKTDTFTWRGENV